MSSPTPQKPSRATSRTVERRRSRLGRQRTSMTAKKSRPSGATGMPRMVDHADDVTLAQSTAPDAGQAASVVLPV